MSNLGWYQKMTVAAKKVNGPMNLFLLVAGGGYVVGRSCEVIGKAAYKKIKELRKPKALEVKEYVVDGIYSSEDGLELKFGDRFIVLEQLECAALISKIGDDNNPYIIPISVLHGISDEKQSDLFDN